jgi:putative transposase
MRPTRERFRQSDQTYFITFQTARRQCFFRNERWARLLLDTFERYAAALHLHDFVIMPDHVHLLLTPQVPLERAAQLIKGGFSHSARKSFEWSGDLWQPGFTDHRIRDAADWHQHLEYIQKNVASLQKEAYAFCGTHSAMKLEHCPPRLKPFSVADAAGGAEAPPLQIRDVVTICENTSENTSSSNAAPYPRADDSSPRCRSQSLL